MSLAHCIWPGMYNEGIWIQQLLALSTVSPKCQFPSSQNVSAPALTVAPSAPLWRRLTCLMFPQRWCDRFSSPYNFPPASLCLWLTSFLQSAIDSHFKKKTFFFEAWMRPWFLCRTKGDGDVKYKTKAKCWYSNTKGWYYKKKQQNPLHLWPPGGTVPPVRFKY